MAIKVEYLKQLLGLKQQGKTCKEISVALNIPHLTVENQLRRMRERVKTTGKAFDNNIKEWTDNEIALLDYFLSSKKSHVYIATKLKRTIESIRGKVKKTDWKAWRLIHTNLIREVKKDPDSFLGGKATTLQQEEEQMVLERAVDSLLTLIRYDHERLNAISKKEFVSKLNVNTKAHDFDFNEIKKMAFDKLTELGFTNPQTANFEQGTYVIVGDSHGKHTKKEIFGLLKNFCNFLKPQKIIHIGHILDDDNDISYDWGNFKNLIVLAKIDELRMVQGQRNRFDFNYEIIKDCVSIGNLIVTNQDLISDYVKTPIDRLDSEIFDERSIVNSHRLEFSTRCINDNTSYIASPGCLCEKHITRTIKQIDFEDGRVIKQAFHEGFSKYRRMSHMCEYWKNGLIVVHVDKDNNTTIIPCPIKKTNMGYAVSYFDKIITGKNIFNPDKKIFVIGDIHSDMHDPNIVDIQEKVCKDYKPDICVNIGDTHNYSALNHHLMNKNIPIRTKVLDEAAQTHLILKRIATWAKESYLMYGNHERFGKDFVDRFPQFDQYLDLRLLCDIESLGYKLIHLKEVLKIGPTKFVHGDLDMYGQVGTFMEKVARTFGEDVFVGHVHYPAIRFGCCSVGLTGLFDQHYNEPNASRWLHGFGMCNQFQGKGFSTTIAIIENKCVIKNKTYSPSNIDSWKVKNYRARLVFSY